jgi:hypothetical protein
MKYWLYDDNRFYTGKQQESKTPVKNGSCFEPNPAPDGHNIVFDGYGWIHIPDIQSKHWTLAEATSLASGLINELKFKSGSSYSPAEQATFDSQYQEALAVKAGSPAGPYLVAISSATGESVDSLVAKVISKRTAFAKAQATFGAQVQVLRNKISNAKTSADLPTYTEITRLASVK